MWSPINMRCGMRKRRLRGSLEVPSKGWTAYVGLGRFMLVSQSATGSHRRRLVLQYALTASVAVAVSSMIGVLTDKRLRIDSIEAHAGRKAASPSRDEPHRRIRCASSATRRFILRTNLGLSCRMMLKRVRCPSTEKHCSGEVKMTLYLPFSMSFTRRGYEQLHI